MAIKALHYVPSNFNFHIFIHVWILFQSEWDAAKIFEEDAPKKADPDNTYVATFPYPYMNGKLQLGNI